MCILLGLWPIPLRIMSLAFGHVTVGYCCNLCFLRCNFLSNNHLASGLSTYHDKDTNGKFSCSYYWVVHCLLLEILDFICLVDIYASLSQPYPWTCQCCCYCFPIAIYLPFIWLYCRSIWQTWRVLTYNFWVS